jgi:hypothetical protein
MAQTNYYKCANYPIQFNKLRFDLVVFVIAYSAMTKVTYSREEILALKDSPLSQPPENIAEILEIVNA